MVFLNIDKNTYFKIHSLLPDIWPNIRVELIEMDENLEKLGFCESAPCRVGIDLSSEEYEQLLDDLMQIEVDAYNTHDGKNPPEDDPQYIRYCKYGWIWDVLYSAETQIE